jgi:hypothetical protein
MDFLDDVSGSGFAAGREGADYWFLSGLCKFRHPIPAKLLTLLAPPFLEVPGERRDQRGRGDAVVNITQQCADALDARDERVQRLEQLERITKLFGHDTETVHVVRRGFRGCGFVSTFEKILGDAVETMLRHFLKVNAGGILSAEFSIRPTFQFSNQDTRSVLTAVREFRSEPLRVGHTPPVDEFIGDIAVAHFSSRGHDFLQPAAALAQVFRRKTGFADGDPLAESPDCYSNLVDGSGVARLEGAVDPQRELPGQAARKPGGKLGIGGGRDGHCHTIVT